MEDLSLHVLDIVENAIRAEAKKISIKIVEDPNRDELFFCIDDDGKGMDEEAVKKVLDPFFTTKKGKRIGLGVSLLCQAAEATGGSLKIDSRVGKGTKIEAIFKPGHPDMKPMGKILETMAVLITANPEIQFIYDYEKGDQIDHFDSYGG